MTLLDWRDYFEALAAEHLELNHVPGEENRKQWTFFCLNAEEDTTAFIRTCKMDLFMVLMPYHKLINKNQSTNYTWSKFLAFMILRRVPGKEQRAITAAHNECELIGDDFYTRLLADRHVSITSIEDGTFAMEPIGPMGDNFYGQICMVTNIDQFDQRIKANRWRQPEP